METTRIFMDAAKAEELHKKYLTHRHYESDMDAEIRKAYKLLANGELIVQALASIPAAGLKEDTLPKLAIANAASEGCWLETDGTGAIMSHRRVPNPADRTNTFRFRDGSFPGLNERYRGKRWRFQAHLPTIPIDIRPKRGLENYHVLWEAEWERVPPVDPYLLRRIGKSDMWLVCGMWDLTPVEQAVLAGRMGRAN